MLSAALYTARIPMARVFRHAGKARGASASVLLALHDGAEPDYAEPDYAEPDYAEPDRAGTDRAGTDRAETGWGEAAPREYVTGESVESVLAALGDGPLPPAAVELAAAPLEEALAGLAALDLPRLLAAPGGAPAPAAAAALETALFDLVCRRHGVDGFRALHLAGYGELLTEAPAAAKVATVLDLERDPLAFLTALPAGRREAIAQVKLKAGPEVGPVADLVQRVRDLVPDAAVAVDANGAWAVEDVLDQAPRLVRAGVAWLEEPLAPRRWEDLARLRRAGLTVMLDESCASAGDLAECAAREAADLVNLRVSKCGGPLRLLALARAARATGLGCQLGVQVGEVGPLWAAGRLIGTALRACVAVEAGRQDEWFPPELTRPAFRVDRDTSLAPPLTGPGIGLRPEPALLELCTPHPVHPVRQAAPPRPLPTPGGGR